MARVRRLGPQAQPSFLLACTQPRVAWTCSVHRVCRRQRCTPYFQVAARRAACTRPCFRTARRDAGLARTETIQDTRLVALRRALFRSTHGRRRYGHQSPFVLFPPRVFDARRRLAFSRYCHVVLGITTLDVFRLEVFEWRVHLGHLLGRWRGQAWEPASGTLCASTPTAPVPAYRPSFSAGSTCTRSARASTHETHDAQHSWHTGAHLA